jgi:D-serine dehydratase
VLDLTALSRHTLSSASKGIPDILDGVTIEDAPKRRLNLLRDEFPAPVAVIRESALRANIELMRQYTESAGVRLAPHGKTTMCPQLFDLQLAAGAWGMTCATAAHLRVYRRFGVPRIIMANQLLDADSVRFVARELAADPGFEFFGIVDSVAGARQYYEVLSKLPRGRALNLWSNRCTNG